MEHLPHSDKVMLHGTWILCSFLGVLEEKDCKNISFASLQKYMSILQGC